MGISVVAAITTFLVFEPIMLLVHRWVFHGPLWSWHRSHHEHPNVHRLVTNDFIWVGFFVLSGVLILLGATNQEDILLGIGIGSTLYGMAYIFAHDGVAHGRFKVPRFVKGNSFFRRLTQNHYLHHLETRDRVGEKPFGVYSSPIELGWHSRYGRGICARICRG